MDVFALDNKLNLVTTGIPFDNLQWNRKYYEAGDYALQVPRTVYSDDWYYIGRTDRRELGMVEKVTSKSRDDDHVSVSGFFCEKMLDDKVCWPWFTGSYKTSEQAARALFSTYKEDLVIQLGEQNETPIGSAASLNFSDTELGQKLYKMLQLDEASYRVELNYDTGKLYMTVWKGLDRTQSQAVNPTKTFSTDFGNIAGKELNLDDSDYKNYAIVPFNDNGEGRELGYFTIDMSNGSYKRKITYDFRSRRPDPDSPYVDIAAMKQEVKERLLERQPVRDIDIEIVEDGTYTVDYDLGDKCDIQLEDIGITLAARIVEVNEVIKASGSTITIGLGNKRIDNLRRAVHR